MGSLHTYIIATSFSLFNNATYLSISLHSRRKSIVFYLRVMAITHSDELRHSPSVRDTKSSSSVIRVGSLNNLLYAKNALEA
jgi:hypothetical protein